MHGSLQFFALGFYNLYSIRFVTSRSLLMEGLAREFRIDLSDERDVAGDIDSE